MADPYAARENVPGGEQPAGDGPLANLVASLGGLPLQGPADLEDDRLDSARFVAVVVHDEGILPPLARIDADFALVILLRPEHPSEQANRVRGRLVASGLDVFLIKEGVVAGPASKAGAFVVEQDLVAKLLAAALAGEVGWEVDPDFGYEVAAQVPDLGGVAADALCPRLLYARADRAYEHAEAVAATKALRHLRLAPIEGLDERILAASGWPIKPTGQDWKD